jgi:putative colanic acid biosynthesis UDP-glucose lipid carrier transferase
MTAQDGSVELGVEPFPGRFGTARGQRDRAVSLAAKRGFDLTLALVGLFLLAPLLLVIALAIRAETRGPALFRQSRGGIGGRPFRILKFRTMTVVEDGAEVRQAQRDDKRVTRLGAILRRTSLDELPQLLNVLTGDMSFVGPRPHALAHDQQYARQLAGYTGRHRVKPGITGWAQVQGARGETPHLSDMRRRVELDLWYVEHWSMLLDLKILFRTVGEIARVDDVY